MSNYFQYNADCDIPESAFRISPSQLSYFFDQTSSWYRTQLLGEEGFTGSTASELGNVVHAAAAMYFDSKSVDKQALLDYIASITDPEIDKLEIQTQMKPMIECLINSFLANTPATDSELFISHKLADDIYVAGTADLVDTSSGILYDFKTMGSLDKARVPTKFPRNYYFQQLCYSWILHQQGHNIQTMKLVYISRDNTGRISEKTGKPMKDYPSECNIVSHQIQPEELDMMSDILNLIKESVQLWHAKPELRHILMQDMRYKYTKPKLFGV
jgi:hypothetical protein